MRREMKGSLYDTESAQKICIILCKSATGELGIE